MRCDDINHSHIIVYCDGPKNSDQLPLVQETRQIAVSLLGNRAEYHFSDVNLGLARSIIDGVGSVVSRYGRAIVLEDDLECSTSFLSFMNLALDKYATDSRIWQVSGYMFNLPKDQKQDAAFFFHSQCLGGGPPGNDLGPGLISQHKVGVNWRMTHFLKSASI